METVPVPLNIDVFRRLQAYIEPIVDDQNSVLTKIFDHWDATGQAKKRATITPPEPMKKEYFKTSRGTLLPIGLQMWADYLGTRLEAEVKEGGIYLADGSRFDDPSGAAKAAKLKLGVSETTASTNGWTFWYMNSLTAKNKVCLIDYFRSKKG